jgi:hypothetical protein
VRIFWALILNSVLFHSYLCINSTILPKKFFDWALGEDTIVLRTLSIRRTKNFQQARYNFLYFLVIHEPILFANNSFSKIRSTNRDRGGFMCQNFKNCLAYSETKQNRL